MKTIAVSYNKLRKAQNKLSKKYNIVLATSNLINNTSILNGFKNKIEAVEWLGRMGYDSKNPIKEFVNSSNAIIQKVMYDYTTF